MVHLPQLLLIEMLVPMFKEVIIFVFLVLAKLEIELPKVELLLDQERFMESVGNFELEAS